MIKTLIKSVLITIVSLSIFISGVTTFENNLREPLETYTPISDTIDIEFLKEKFLPAYEQ